MVVEPAAGPGEWRADDVRGNEAWIVRLDEEHRREVLAAVRATERSTDSRPTATNRQADPRPAPAADPALDPGSADGFPLPTLGPVLGRVREELVDGRGFVLVRGVPVEEMTQREREVAAVGLARHVGEVMPQGPEQAPLMHVRDTGSDPSEGRTRSYEHRGRLGYHSDPYDVVALLCVRPAKAGGLSAIVSSVAVHNEIVRLRPDLAEELYRPWWHDRRTGDGPDSFYTKPICVRRPDGGLSIAYGPDYLRSAQRGASVPPLTAAQLEVMALLDELTNDPRFAMTMELQAGDMQFLNNHVVLHSRTAFEDHPEPERRRHLLRLWVTVPRNGTDTTAC
ncbi:TauD/TfdA family dioxygenase [Nonomuraea sp. NPDC049504]|uniref:TauD/TfdA family dioxygenase n=1 Tax=Nonomuraea sp. NPDC049504 TaxID=3154729 RepID=UPI003443A524